MSEYVKWFNLRKAYRNIFWSGQTKPDDVRRLIKDLRGFCRADESCVVVAPDGKIDTHATAVAEGRREVFLRIIQTLHLSDETLMKLKEQEDE